MGFFLNHHLGCTVTGIEYDERIFKQAVANHRSYESAYEKRGRIDFRCINAEDYEITEEANCFYSFTPFSIQILQSVLGRIMDSYYDAPREMLLFFYYPNDEYISCLMTSDELQFLDEIDCQDLFEGKNERERILIFEVNG